MLYISFQLKIFQSDKLFQPGTFYLQTDLQPKFILAHHCFLKFEVVLHKINLVQDCKLQNNNLL